MPATRRLAPEELGRWSALLTPDAANIQDPEAFAAWLGQVRGLARLGLIEVQGVFGEGEAADATAALLIQPNGRHRTVVAGVGDLGGEALAAAMADVQARSDALTWSAEAGADWAERLAGLGVRPFWQQAFVNPLAESAGVLAREPGAPELMPWDDAWRDEVVGMLAAANAGRLAGLMLVLPGVPTALTLRGTFMRVLADPAAFMPEASFLYMLDGRPAGAILLVRRAEGPTLYEVAVHPAARGRRAGQRLVRAAQRALVAAGHAEMWFWTTDDNASVHRIYEPEEVELRETHALAYWLREGVA